MNRIEEIKQRLEAATPGPWKEDPMGLYVWSDGVPNMVAQTPFGSLVTEDVPEGAGKVSVIRGWGELSKRGEEFAIKKQKANARLIAHAPQDLAYLISEVERLQAEVQSLTRE